MNQYGKIPSISMMRVKVTWAINLDMFLINLLLFPLSSLLEDTAWGKLRQRQLLISLLRMLKLH